MVTDASTSGEFVGARRLNPPPSLADGSASRSPAWNAERCSQPRHDRCKVNVLSRYGGGKLQVSILALLLLALTSAKASSTSDITVVHKATNVLTTVYSAASLGDWNGDNTTSEVAVGGTATSGGSDTVVLVDFDKTTLTATTLLSLSDGQGGIPTGTLDSSSGFGASVAYLGDLGAGHLLAAGASTDGDFGALLMLMLDPSTNTLTSVTKVTQGLNGMPNGTFTAGTEPYQFGRGMTFLGDLGAGNILAVGCVGDSDIGAVHMLQVASSGAISYLTKLSNGVGGIPAGTIGGYFGYSVHFLGDLGQGPLLAVGAPWFSASGGLNNGAIHTMVVASNGTVTYKARIAKGESGIPSAYASNVEYLGASLAYMGNADNLLAVGCINGNIYFLEMLADGTARKAHKVVPGSDGLPSIASSTTGRSMALIDGQSDGTVLLSGINGLRLIPTNAPRIANYTRLSPLMSGAGGTTVTLPQDSTATFDGWLPAFSTAEGTLTCSSATSCTVPPSARFYANVTRSDDSNALLYAELEYATTSVLNDVLWFDRSSLDVTTSTTSAQLGASLARLGDADADGCSREYAVGAPGMSLGGAIFVMGYDCASDRSSAPTQHLVINPTLLGSTAVPTSSKLGSSVHYVTTTDVSPTKRTTYLWAGTPGADAALLLALEHDNGTWTASVVTRLADGVGGVPASTVASGSSFGSAVAMMPSEGRQTGRSFVGPLLIGAPGKDSSAGGVLHMSANSRTGAVSGTPQWLDTSSLGLVANDEFGRSLALRREDTDPSGTVWQLIVGAPGTGADKGAVYILQFDANNSTTSTTWTTLKSGAPLDFSGLTTSRRFGSSVVWAGDLDRDGKAQEAVVGMSSAGRLVVLWTDPQADSVDLPSYVVVTPTNSYQTGVALVPGGDWDGDGAAATFLSGTGSSVNLAGGTTRIRLAVKGSAAPLPWGDAAPTATSASASSLAFDQVADLQISGVGLFVWDAFLQGDSWVENPPRVLVSGVGTGTCSDVGFTGTDGALLHCTLPGSLQRHRTVQVFFGDEAVGPALDLESTFDFAVEGVSESTAVLPSGNGSRTFTGHGLVPSNVFTAQQLVAAGVKLAIGDSGECPASSLVQSADGSSITCTSMPAMPAGEHPVRLVLPGGVESNSTASITYALPSPSPTPTPSPSATASPSPTPSTTATRTATPSPSPTPSQTPTPSVTPSPSPTPSITPSPSPSPTTTAAVRKDWRIAYEEVTVSGGIDRDSVALLARDGDTATIATAQYYNPSRVRLFSVNLKTPAVTHLSTLSNGVNGVPTGMGNDGFGVSVAALRDFGNVLAVGAYSYGTYGGSVVLMTVNATGQVSEFHGRLANGMMGIPPGAIPNFAHFGWALAYVGDLGAGRLLAVGARGAGYAGEVWLVALSSTTLEATHLQRVGSGVGGIPAGTLGSAAYFGGSLAFLDGFGSGNVLAVGASNLNVGGEESVGGIFLLSLNATGYATLLSTVGEGKGGFPVGSFEGNDQLGRTIAYLGDAGAGPILLVGDTTGSNRLALVLDAKGEVAEVASLQPGDNGLPLDISPEANIFCPLRMSSQGSATFLSVSRTTYASLFRLDSPPLSAGETTVAPNFHRLATPLNAAGGWSIEVPDEDPPFTGFLPRYWVGSVQTTATNLTVTTPASYDPKPFNLTHSDGVRATVVVEAQYQTTAVESYSDWWDEAWADATQVPYDSEAAGYAGTSLIHLGDADNDGCDRDFAVGAWGQVWEGSRFGALDIVSMPCDQGASATARSLYHINGSVLNATTGTISTSNGWFGFRITMLDQRDTATGRRTALAVSQDGLNQVMIIAVEFTVADSSWSTTILNQLGGGKGGIPSSLMSPTANMGFGWSVASRKLANGEVALFVGADNDGDTMAMKIDPVTGDISSPRWVGQDLPSGNQGYISASLDIAEFDGGWQLVIGANFEDGLCVQEGLSDDSSSSFGQECGAVYVLEFDEASLNVTGWSRLAPGVDAIPASAVPPYGRLGSVVVAPGDLDGDGKKEEILATYNSDSFAVVWVRRNAATGKFEAYSWAGFDEDGPGGAPPSSETYGGFSTGLDWDGDGATNDVLVGFEEAGGGYPIRRLHFAAVGHGAAPWGEAVASVSHVTPSTGLQHDRPWTITISGQALYTWDPLEGASDAARAASTVAVSGPAPASCTGAVVSADGTQLTCTLSPSLVSSRSLTVSVDGSSVSPAVDVAYAASLAISSVSDTSALPAAGNESRTFTGSGLLGFSAFAHEELVAAGVKLAIGDSGECPASSLVQSADGSSITCTSMPAMPAGEHPVRLVLPGGVESNSSLAVTYLAPTPSPTATATSTPTPSTSPTATMTSTPTPSPSATSTVSPTPTSTTTPTLSPSPSQTPSQTPSPSPACAGDQVWTGSGCVCPNSTEYVAGSSPARCAACGTNFEYNADERTCDCSSPRLYVISESGDSTCVDACPTGTEYNSADRKCITETATNLPPVARVWPDQIVAFPLSVDPTVSTSAVSFTLDASDSADPEGSALSYLWKWQHMGDAGFAVPSTSNIVDSAVLPVNASATDVTTAVAAAVGAESFYSGATLSVSGFPGTYAGQAAVKDADGAVRTHLRPVFVHVPAVVGEPRPVDYNGNTVTACYNKFACRIQFEVAGLSRASEVRATVRAVQTDSSGSRVLDVNLLWDDTTSSASQAWNLKSAPTGVSVSTSGSFSSMKVTGTLPWSRLKAAIDKANDLGLTGTGAGDFAIGFLEVVVEYAFGDFQRAAEGSETPGVGSNGRFPRTAGTMKTVRSRASTFDFSGSSTGAYKLGFEDRYALGTASAWGSCETGQTRADNGNVCGNGKRYRTQACVDDLTGDTVARLLCGSTGQVDLSESCFSGLCQPFGFEVGAWGTCSKACGGGVRSRNVTCMEDVSGTATPRADSSCNNNGLVTPVRRAACNSFQCESFSWQYGAWRTCSKPCADQDGAGRQTRSATCKGSYGTIKLGDAATTACGTRSEAVSQSCNTGTCPSFLWKANSWGSCSKSCNDGTAGQRTRTVSCVNGATNVVVADSNCGSTTSKPATSESCNDVKCFRLSYVATSWGACTNDCGGVRNRTVNCVEKHMYTSALGNAGQTGVVPMSRCEAGIPSIKVPATGEVCNECTFCEQPHATRGPCSSESGATTACTVNATDATGQTGKCECGTGFKGQYCHLAAASTLPTCGAGETLDANGNCCAGDLDQDFVCCAGKVAADRTCCASGSLDPCGNCDTDFDVRDNDGECCARAAVDAGGSCCAGTLDSCGVCNGLDSCKQSTGGSLGLQGTDSSSIDSSSSDSFSSVACDGINNADCSSDISSSRRLVRQLVARHTRSLRRRRLATCSITAGTTASVELSISADDDLLGLDLNQVDPETISTKMSSGDAASALGATSTCAGALSDPVVVPECGNDVCETGERCAIDETESPCCHDDCPVPIAVCDVGDNGEVCSGRGSCTVDASGKSSCDCFVTGYTGEVCDECSFGYSRSGSRCRAQLTSTCYDSVQNGDEEGVDCGGRCSTVCSDTPDDGGSGGRKRKLSGGAIAGIVLGCLAVAAIVTVVVVLLVRSGKRSNRVAHVQHDEPSDAAGDEGLKALGPVPAPGQSA